MRQTDQVNRVVSEHGRIVHNFRVTMAIGVIVAVIIASVAAENAGTGGRQRLRTAGYDSAGVTAILIDLAVQAVMVNMAVKADMAGVVAGKKYHASAGLDAAAIVTRLRRAACRFGCASIRIGVAAGRNQKIERLRQLSQRHRAVKRHRRYGGGFPVLRQQGRHRGVVICSRLTAEVLKMLRQGRIQ